MSTTAQTKTETEIQTELQAETQTENSTVAYDSNAQNRFTGTVLENGVSYETAHIFKPLTDERYLQWIGEFNVSGSDEDSISEETDEASCRLWDDLIHQVENVEYDDVEWKNLIDYREKFSFLRELLAVSIVEPEKTGRVRRLGAAGETQIIKTEAWVNNDVSVQEHEMPVQVFEYQKKYARIQAKRFKKEITTGLRRKQKIEFVPQDAAIGRLYDEMVVSNKNFVGSVPLRFKVRVVDHLFAEKVNEKKP